MYDLGHWFWFIDPIKIKPNQSNFLELFDLTLNTVNIKTSSVETTGVDTP